MTQPDDETFGLHGRAGWIWRDHCKGMPQVAIAAKYGISPPAVSQSLTRTRASIPEDEREHIVQRELDMLDMLRQQAAEIMALPAAPITAGKDGVIVRDPETNDVVRDYAGKLAAMDRIIKTHERYAKMLGLDAPVKHDVTLTEAAEQAAAGSAADAAQYLSGSADGALG